MMDICSTAQFGKKWKLNVFNVPACFNHFFSSFSSSLARSVCSIIFFCCTKKIRLKWSIRSHPHHSPHLFPSNNFNRFAFHVPLDINKDNCVCDNSFFSIKYETEKDNDHRWLGKMAGWTTMFKWLFPN